MGPIRSRAVVLLAGVIVCCAAGAGLLGWVVATGHFSFAGLAFSCFTRSASTV